MAISSSSSRPPRAAPFSSGYPRINNVKVKRHTIWPCALVISIYAASSQSTLTVPDVGVSYDKLAHLLVFGLLATAVLRIPYVINKGWHGVLFTILIVSGYAILDEFRQSLTPGRAVELNDWIADTLGAIIASILYLKWQRYRQFWEYSIPLRRRQ